METSVTSRTLIEYFLLLQKEQDKEKLLYYDGDGNQFEKEIQRGLVDEALAKFDGTPKSVMRSTGGMVKAMPYQLVIYDPDIAAGQMHPEVRIKVKFKDFKKDAKGNYLPHEYTIATKVLSPSEIQDSVSYNLQGSQRFVVDFGRGIVPIYVFRYAMNARGETLALFVELSDMEKIVDGAPGNRTEVQAYQVSRDILRVACAANRHGIDEYELAIANYKVQKESGTPVIPENLKFGFTVEGPTNLTARDFRRYVSRALNKQKFNGKESETRTDFGSEEDTLMPFEENHH